MKLRDSYPIYLNPEWNELVEIAESRWDTLRVMESNKLIAIASGYGNTHETICYFYAEHLNLPRIEKNGRMSHRWGGKSPDWDPFIFFHDNSGIMLCNLGDVSGPDRAMPRQWKKAISNEHVILMCQIAELSGLRHDS